MKNNNQFTLKKLTIDLKKIKAKDIMTREVITVNKNETLDNVAKLMIDKRISGFPVLEDDNLVGIITANDLFMVMDMIKTGETIKNNNSDGALPKVSYAMSTEIITVSPQANLDKIIALMKYRNVHTLPVLSGKKMVGIIGRRDVYKNFYCTVQGICSIK